ncbi:GNAT family N-acetyltransferase [Bordetella tumulicola]|uniref:GNAT family N-acetyltransferase n=1 Tax=Bordetella tumulicola TaxID=1649133 RepID=UPI0039EF425A
MTSFELRPIDSEQDLQACFPVMQELRPHLTDLTTFIAQVRRQADQGYRLLAAWQDDQALGLAGYRLQENLIYGRFLYVDDLVTTAQARGHGVGEALIKALRNTAKQRDCAHFVLDTGLANDLAQRFYFRQGLLSKGLHFCQPLSR